MNTPAEVLPIDSDATHAAYLAEIEQLMEHDPPKGSPEGERLDKLVDATETYEKARWPMGECPDCE